MTDILVFDDFDTVPLDVPPEDEGDDSIHGHDLGAGIAALTLLRTPRPTLDARTELLRTLVVPHPRDLKLGDKGSDVLALHRALSRAGYHDWELRNVSFGPILEADLKRFQKHVGLTGDGVYGTKTHAKLAPFYTAFEINLILQYAAPETPQQIAQRKMIAASMALYNMRDKVHYTMGPARMFIVKHYIRTLEKLSTYTSIWEDCSSSVTGLFYMASCPDPNQFGYNGLGYTGTLALHGKPVTQDQVGMLQFYGYGYPWKHVAIVVSAGAGKTTRVFSFGSENGPYLLDRTYRGDLGARRIYAGMSY